MSSCASDSYTSFTEGCNCCIASFGGTCTLLAEGHVAATTINVLTTLSLRTCSPAIHYAWVFPVRNGRQTMRPSSKTASSWCCIMYLCRRGCISHLLCQSVVHIVSEQIQFLLALQTTFLLSHLVNLLPSHIWSKTTIQLYCLPHWQAEFSQMPLMSFLGVCIHVGYVTANNTLPDSAVTIKGSDFLTHVPVPCAPQTFVACIALLLFAWQLCIYRHCINPAFGNQPECTLYRITSHLKTYTTSGHVYQSCRMFILQAMHGQIQLLTIRGLWTSGGHMPLFQMTFEMACCMTATSAVLAHWHLLSTAVLVIWTRAKLR